MKDIILEKLNFAAEKLPLQRFFRPDGVATAVPPFPSQPYDRLLFLLNGTKTELMSLNGELCDLKLRPGDFWLMAKGIWESSAMTERQNLLCMVPRTNFLRISYYDIIEPGKPREPLPQPLFFHTARPTPNALQHAIAALKTVSGTAAADLARAALRIAVAECARSESGVMKSNVTLERVLEYIEYNFSAPLTRENVAEKHRLNPSYLSQLFRRGLNRSFQEYLCHCRMEHAKTLLTETALSVKEIAAVCGFGDEVYFIRRFREMNGIPPGKYRINVKTV